MMSPEQSIGTLFARLCAQRQLSSDMEMFTIHAHACSTRGHGFDHECKNAIIILTTSFIRCIWHISTRNGCAILG